MTDGDGSPGARKRRDTENPHPRRDVHPESMSKADPPPPPPPRRTALGCLGLLVRRTVQGAVLGVLLVLMLLVGWLRSEDFRVRSTRIVETLLEGRLGEEITLTDLDVRFWPPGVEASGFHVFDRDTGDTIVSAERVRVPVVLRDGGVGIGQLFLQRPFVHLHLDEKGRLLEFRDAARSDPPQPLRRLPWSGLRIVDGEFRLEHPQGEIVVDGLDLLPTAGPVTDVHGRLRVRVRDWTDEAVVALEGATLGPDRIVLPPFVLDLRTVDLEGQADVVLGGAIDADATARIELEELNALFEPPRAAHGVVDLDLRAEGTPDDPVLYVNAAGWRLGADMPGVFTPLLTYELGEITASAVARKSGIDLEQVVLNWADGRVVAWGHVTPDRRLVDGHVTMEDIRLEPLLRAFDAAPTPWVDFRGDSEVAWEGTLDPLRLEGTFELGVSELRVADRPIARPDAGTYLRIPHANARGGIVLDKKHIVFDATHVRGPRSTGSTVVDIGFGPRGPLDLEFDLSGADLSDFGPLANTRLQGRGRVTGRIWGEFNRLQFLGEGDVRDFSVLGIEYADRLVARIRSPDMKSIWLEDATADLGASRYHGYYRISFRSPVSMDTAIEVDRGRVEDLVHMFVDLDGLKGDLTGTLWLKGPLFDLDGEAHLAFHDAEIYGERFPTGEGHGYMDRGLFTLDDLRVRRADGTAGLTLRGSVERKWALDMQLVADGLELQRLDRLAPYDLPLTGRLSAVARITNTLYDPSPDGTIRLTGLTYAGVPAEDSILFVDSEGGIARYTGSLLGGAAKVEGTLGLWGEQPYALTAELARLPAHLFYPVAADGSPVRAVVSGSLAVSGDFGEVWSPVTLRSRLDEVDVRYASHALRNQGPWSYEQDGDRFELGNFGLVGGLTDFRLSARGGDQALDLEGSGVVDLDLLRAVVPGLEKSSGTATVALEARGTRPNVEAVVTVDVASQLFRHGSAPITFEDTRARIEVREDRIELLSLDGGLGGGTFTLDPAHRTVACEKWRPVRYDLGMRVDDAQVQWVETLPPAIGGASLRFDGPVGALLLHGQLTVSDMTFAERIDWEDWVVESRAWMLVDPAQTSTDEPMFSLDLEIGADRTIRLQNNLAEGFASADLRILGDTVRPGLVGTVTVHDGLAFLQDREFIVDRGVLLWNDPWTWDPQLDISLLTDISSRDTVYRVNYLVYGPFSDWHSTSRSDPFLAQADVNALLWFGMTTDDLEALGELPSAVAQGVADMLVTDFFVSGRAAGDLGQELPVQVDLATGVNVRGEYSPDPRLLVEKRIDELGTVIEWEFNLVRPDDNYVSSTWRIGRDRSGQAPVTWSLSSWYATLQRDRVLPIGGAYGMDVVARWEME